MFNRRSMLARGATAIGAGLSGPGLAPAAAQPAGSGGGTIFDVQQFGATGRRADNATQAFRAAVDACASAGGGTVYVPPGEYTVGTTQLKDNVTLHIEAGARLLLSQSRADFIRGSRAMIFAEGASNIAVTGRGTLDGQAQYVWAEPRGADPEIIEEIEIARKAGLEMRRYYRTGMQTFMFVINNSSNVLIRDVSVVNSPLWNVRLSECDRVFLRGVYIYSDLEKGVNADGIDVVSSRNVTVSDSVIVTADDAIVLKSMPGAGAPRPVENVTVTNCVLSSSSTPLMIGTETHADIRHVIFSNCVIRNSNKGFGINVQDGATVSDVIFSNLTMELNRRHWNWWGSAEMCKFVLKKRTPASRLGAIRDIVIDNVIAHARGTSTITGHADRPLENVRISGVQLFMNQEDARDKRATHAMQIEDVRGLSIRDLSVKWAEDQVEDKWQSALALKRVADFEINSFSGRQGLLEGGAPALLLEDVADGTIRDSRATKGCRTFLRVAGGASRDIALRNNDFRQGDKGVSFESEAVRKAVTVPATE